MKIPAIIGAFCIFSNLSAQIVKTDLNTNWQFRQEGESKWMKASVPGTVHTDLLASNKIEDPYYRLNEKDQQWIENANWEYESGFRVDEKLLYNEKIELVFEGLDTYADVYLNGTKVISADNMFVSWKAEVKNLLKIGDNKLSINFYSPINRVMPAFDSLPFTVPVSDNDQAEKRVSVYTRKAGYHYGWDWGPRFVTSGIWRPVYLAAWNEIKIEDLFIRQVGINGSSATMEAQVTAECSSEGVRTLKVFIDENPVPVISREVMVLKGENIISARFGMENIKLWWPNGMGAQDMYTFRTELSGKNGIIASTAVKRGLRTIEVVNESTSKGKTFYLKVNGKPVFMKGANYIPQDNFLPRVTRERYEHVINTAAESHMNMLRVWGGGIYENDVFYELCDEKGMLVWQDFMFACAMYPPLDYLRKNIKDEAAYNVKRLRNHPSIALWCGNNEILAFMNSNYWGALKGKTLSPKDSASLFNTYDEIFHGILPSAVKAYDDDKFYWSSSCSNENYTLDFKFTTLSGDVHYWDVWWGKAPFEKYNDVVGPFMSEYGFQSFPEFETVKKYTTPADYDIDSEVMNAHQRSSIGNSTITYYMKDMFKVPAKFEDFLYVGQVLQADGIKMAIEAHRRAKPYCMGSLFWQIDDCWPVASWSSMDYYGRWKAQQYMAKRAYDDYLVSPVKENETINIYAVSDLYKSENATIQVSLLDFNGKVLRKETNEIHLTENSSSVVFSLKEVEWVTDKTRKNVFLNMKLFIGGVEVARNNYFFEKAKNLNLPKTKIKVEQLNPNTLEVSTDKFAKSVWLDLPGAVNAFSDNYFDLLPGEKREVVVKTNDLKSMLIKISVKSLTDAY